VVDVVAMKTTKMRGQAFIVFKEISSSTQALRALQGFSFYDKPIVNFYSEFYCDLFMILFTILLVFYCDFIVILL